MNTASKTILTLLGALSKTGAVNFIGSMTDEEYNGYLPNDGSAEECPNSHGMIDNRDWKDKKYFAETPEQENRLYWWGKMLEYQELAEDPAEC